MKRVMAWTLGLLSGFLTLAAQGEDDALATLGRLVEIQADNLGRITSFELDVDEALTIRLLEEGRAVQYSKTCKHTEITLPQVPMTSVKRLENTDRYEDGLLVKHQSREVYFHHNPEYVFFYETPNSAGWLYKPEDSGEYPRDAELRIQSATPHSVLRSGFGIGARSLSQLHELLLGGAAVGVTLALDAVDAEQDAHTFSLNQDGKKRQDFTVCAKRGGLISASHDYTKDERIRKKVAVTIKHFESEGLWFPMAWTVTSYQFVDGVQQSTGYEAAYTVLLARFNPPDAEPRSNPSALLDSIIPVTIVLSTDQSKTVMSDKTPSYDTSCKCLVPIDGILQ